MIKTIRKNISVTLEQLQIYSKDQKKDENQDEDEGSAI